MARAADGAMWLTGHGLRAPDPARARRARCRSRCAWDEIPNRLAPDAAGRCLVHRRGRRPAIRHVDAAGTVTRFTYDLRRGLATDVAVGPGRRPRGSPPGPACSGAGGRRRRDVRRGRRSPPARSGFDPRAGSGWRAAARVVRTRPRASSATPAATRRRRGVRIRPALGRPIRVAEVRKGLTVEIPRRRGSRSPRATVSARRARLEQDLFSSADEDVTYTHPEAVAGPDREACVAARASARGLDVVRGRGSTARATSSTVGDEFRVRR